MVLKAFKLRLYPNKSQRNQMFVNLGCVRFVWNQMLNMQIERHKNNKEAKHQSRFAMDNMLKALKLEYPWLKQADSTSLQNVNRNLDDAFQRFFNPKLKSGFPKFKSKKNANQSYTSKSVNNNIKITDKHHVKLPKLGLVYFRAGRLPQGKIKLVTIRINSQSQYEASVLVESENQTFDKTGKVVGIDLGLKDLIITSDGHKESIFRIDEEANHKLKIWERKKSRRYELAKQAMAFDKHDKVLFPRTDLNQFPRYQQAKRTVAKLKRHIANQRKDKLHKLTTKLVKEYDVIVVENLSAKNMMQNHHLAKSIANASWGILVELLKYKCAWYGKTLIMVDPKNTSRICFECKQKNYEFDNLSQSEWLATREWVCPNCHSYLDRDINASKNILAKGLATWN